MSRTKNKIKKVKVTQSIAEPQVEILQAIAEKKGVGLQDVVRAAISMYISEHGF